MIANQITAKNSRKTNWLHLSEKIFVVISLLHYSAAILPVLITRGASEGDGTLTDFDFSLNRNLFLLNYIIVFGLLLLRWKKIGVFLRGNFLLFALIMLLPASYLWSAMPDETLSAAIGMIGTVLFGIYLASRYTLKELLELICWTFGLSITLSILFAVLLPKYGIMGGVHTGAMRGVYTHKNQFGKAMILGMAMFLAYAKSTPSRSWLPWIGVGTSFTLVILSASSSSLLNGVVLMTIILSAQVIQLRGKNLFFALLLLGALVFALSQWFLPMLETLVNFMGKDMTLTGRTDIWPYSITKIQERPWLGYGFNGFWNGIRGESLDMILTLGWHVPNSHNGFIDLWLDLGFVGFSMFFLLLWSLIVKLVFILRHRFDWVYVWPFALIVYTIIINITETSLISQNSLGWLLFITVTLSVNRDFAKLTRDGDIWQADQRLVLGI